MNVESDAAPLFEPRSTVVGVTAMISFLAASAASAGGLDNSYSAAEILRNALAQTVEIRTAIEYGFGEDDPGTFLGAGFVVDRQRGWIATARHVVGISASRVNVAAAGGKFQEARKLYVDPLLDLAVVAVDPQQLNGVGEARLDCGDAPATGQNVFLVGHPASLKYSVTRGIVSRTAIVDGEAFIQTDAAIGSGNSGGPLVSLSTGNVLGIVVKQMSRRTGAGFALPSEGLCRVLELLRHDRNPAPPDLGVTFFQADDDATAPKVARRWNPDAGLPLQEGDQIESVLQEGNRVLRVNSVSALLNALRGHLGAIRLAIRRNGQSITLAGHAQPANLAFSERGLLVGGVLFAESEDHGRREFGLERLRVHQVNRASDGEMKGIRVGDLVSAVNGVPVSTLEQMTDAVRQNQTEMLVKLRRVAWENGQVSYLEKSLRPDSVRWIGMDDGIFQSASQLAHDPDLM